MLTLQWKKRISVMNKAMKYFAGLAVMLLTILSACSKSGSHSDYLLNVDSDHTTETFRFGLDQVARVFAALPIGAEQVSEVHDAVMAQYLADMTRNTRCDSFLKLRVVGWGRMV